VKESFWKPFSTPHCGAYNEASSQKIRNGVSRRSLNLVNPSMIQHADCKPIARESQKQRMGLTERGLQWVYRIVGGILESRNLWTRSEVENAGPTVVSVL